MAFDREIKSIMILNSLSQEDLAKRLGVTKEEIISLEKGETQPDEEMLKRISLEFNVSVNKLLGSPKKLICQCCGIPMDEDFVISHEPNGSFNENYCMWCYSDGDFKYKSKEPLLDFMMEHMPNPDNIPDDERRAMYDAHLSKLNYWKEMQ